MKKILLVAAMFFLMGGCGQTQNTREARDARDNSSPKILVAYFSWGGNTRGIARQIHERVGGDIFEIEAVSPYPQEFDAVVEIARQEFERQDRPQLKNSVTDFAQYDIIILGFPNWLGTIPMPVATFLETNDFSGKKLIPFCSHGRGGLQNTIDDVTRLAQGAEIGETLAVFREGDESLSDNITEWLANNSI